MTYDVVIIGGGVTGTAIAWQLSRYDISILLVDRCSDFCEGTSKANSGIVHAGYDPVPGTLKARLNIRGNSMIRGLKDALGYDFVQNGAMVVAFSEDELPQLEALRKQGVANGVPGIEVLQLYSSRQAVSYAHSPLHMLSGRMPRQTGPQQSWDVR